jgi:hypothetical protein
MKKTMPAFFCLLLSSGSAWALTQQFLEPITPISPALQAQGGVWAGSAEGWDALFTNPAAFATDKTSLTVLSLGTTGFISMSSLNQVIADRNSLTSFNVTDSNNPTTNLLNSLLTTTGVGGEVTLGSGWVGKNLGVGLLIQGKTFGQGLTLLGSTFTTQQSVVGVLGYAHPFDIGLGTVKVGGTIRPEEISYSASTVSDLASNGANLNSYTVSSGFGLGLDLGARWDYEQFKTGLVIRDLGSTVINFNNYSFSSWAGSGGFPLGGSSNSDIVYRIPTVIALGTSWSPDMGVLAQVMRATVSADLQIPLEDQYTQPSFWTWTHLGVEAQFLDFLAVRAGLNQGYFTFGLGARGFGVDFNLSISTDEMGRYSGIDPRPSLSAELACRL